MISSVSNRARFAPPTQLALSPAAPARLQAAPQRAESVPARAEAEEKKPNIWRTLLILGGLILGAILLFNIFKKKPA